MKISIVTLTYGHEKYIKQAIEGVLMQTGEFEIELIIANDNSPDNTDVIVREYIEENVEVASKIKYTKHSSNLGAISNFIWALNECTGKYIAICDGDDYWTDSFKLKKQIEFLEGNLSCVGHCHNFKIVDTNNLTLDETFTKYQDKNFIDTYDIIADSSLATMTVVFRNIFDQNPVPGDIMNSGNPDKILFAWLGLFGNFYADKKMVAAAYRIHTGGMWSMQPRINIIEKSILTHEAMLSLLPSKYNMAVGRKLAAKRAMLAILIFRSKKRKFIKMYWMAVKTCVKFNAVKVFLSLHKKLIFK